LVFAQLGLGALVAGLRAGRIYNDWPTMGGRFLPGEAFGLTPWFRSIVDDAATAQFDHRMLAYGVVAAAVALAIAATRAAPGTKMASRAKILAGIAFAQAALGIATLLFVAPIPLALAHQALALALFGMAVAHASATQRDLARSGYPAPAGVAAVLSS
jgi:cytochrome c oxidase assembly protein subunit 15